MRKYKVAKAWVEWGYYDADESFATSEHYGISGEADGPRDTGLIDMHGNAIYSFPERHPIGFIIHKPCSSNEIAT